MPALYRVTVFNSAQHETHLISPRIGIASIDWPRIAQMRNCMDLTTRSAAPLANAGNMRWFAFYGQLLFEV
jgi:hypothetical protein